MMSTEQLLTAFWLRPETALWRAIDIDAMRDFKFAGRSLDLGCGDGTFSFVRAGGKFNKDFDVFQHVGKLDQFFANVDVFDTYDEKKHISNPVLKRSDYEISVGFDQKQNLLLKASRLGLYQELKIGDANNKLPFATSSFDTIFSNIIYWLDHPAFAFSEIHRVLDNNGKAGLMLPNTTLQNYTLSSFFCEKKSGQFKDMLALLDRGRVSENIKHAKSQSDWFNLLEAAGLNVVHHSNHLVEPIIRIWDVGLRPLFPLLMRMTNSMEEKEKNFVKEEWVELFGKIIEPLLELELQSADKTNAAFHFIVVEK